MNTTKRSNHSFGKMEQGALYNLGIGNAMRICRGLLRPGGFFAFTDAVWRKEDPPPEVKASFDQDYPAMGTAADEVTAIRIGTRYSHACKREPQ